MRNEAVGSDMGVEAASRAISSRHAPAPAFRENQRPARVQQALGIAAIGLQYCVIPLVFVVVWELLCRAGVVRAMTLPAPSSIGTTIATLLTDGGLVLHVAVSLFRVLQGFFLAALLGFTLGTLVGISTVARRVFDVVIHVLRPIPPIAWIPLAILWFGIGEASKVFIIFLGAFFPIVLNVIEGIRQTDPRLVELAQAFEVSRAKFVRRVVIPGALPAIMTGMRVGLGSAWICVVAAELIAAERGIGYVIVDGRELSRPDVVIAGMISIGVIGKSMDVVLGKLERRFAPWKRNSAGGLG